MNDECDSISLFDTCTNILTTHTFDKYNNTASSFTLYILKKHRRLLKRTKRWGRCLDAEYLSLKIFMLERFLHDILLESSDPRLLRDFVGADPYDDKRPRRS